MLTLAALRGVTPDRSGVEADRFRSGKWRGRRGDKDIESRGSSVSPGLTASRQSMSSLLWGQVVRKERGGLVMDERSYGATLTCEKKSAGLPILQCAGELCTVSIEYSLAPLQ